MRDDLVAEKKTMQVFVYPEVRCRYENGRWVLLPPTAELPPLTELTGEPRPVVQQIVEQIVEPIVEPILPDEKGVYTIEAALWKQSDGYFKVAPGGSRYDPAGELFPMTSEVDAS